METPTTMNELVRFEETLDQLTKDLPVCQVKNALRYALLGAGKRIRPRLIFSFLTKIGEDEFKVAAALEIIHTYSLIHDDLPALDNDDLRRGKPTVHKVYDEAIAILTGDALLNLAFETILFSHLEEKKKILCLQILARNAGLSGMILGQDQDMYPDNFQDSTIRIMYQNKTGKLLGCALALGCVLSDQPQLADQFQNIGENLGIFFQIQDDILEITGDPRLIGKSKDSDLKNEKKTYVAVLGLERAKKELTDLYDHISAQIKTILNDPTRLINLINEIKNRAH